jgi:hypothetical protein
MFHRRRHVGKVYLISAMAAGLYLVGGCAMAQTPPDEVATPGAGSVLPVASAPVPVVVPLNEERIAGVIPDYQTVRESHRLIAPLTAREKWDLAWKETEDPFNNATAVLTAAYSQMNNQTPKYGQGWDAYGKRVGAALGDFDSQNFFSAGLLACLLHQDPRYFRMGPESGTVRRIAYSISRLFVIRQDSGKLAFNASNIFGIILGIAASNAYYPAASRNGTVMEGRLGTSMMGGAVGNLLSEFWPDVQKKFFRKNKTSD